MGSSPLAPRTNAREVTMGEGVGVEVKGYGRERNKGVHMQRERRRRRESNQKCLDSMGRSLLGKRSPAPGWKVQGF